MFAISTVYPDLNHEPCNEEPHCEYSKFLDALRQSHGKENFCVKNLTVGDGNIIHMFFNYHLIFSAFSGGMQDLFEVQNKFVGAETCELHRSQHAAVVKAMTIVMASTNKCSVGCEDYVSRMVADLPSLSLPLSRSVIDSLTEYFKVELVQEGHEGCRFKGEKSFEIAKEVIAIPDILVLQLIRFTWSPEKGTTYIDERCSFDAVLDHPSLPTKYKLMSVVCHSKPRTHYYAYILSGDHWWTFDDLRETVRVDWTDVGNDDAYVLFYRKFQ